MELDDKQAKSEGLKLADIRPLSPMVSYPCIVLFAFEEFYWWFYFFEAIALLAPVDRLIAAPPKSAL
jgi:hypothetical protein